MSDNTTRKPPTPEEMWKVLREVSEMRKEISTLWTENNTWRKKIDARVECLEIEAEEKRQATAKAIAVSTENVADCADNWDADDGVDGDEWDDDDDEEDENSWDEDHKRWKNASKWHKDLTIDYEWDRQTAMLKEALWELLHERGIQVRWVSSGVHYTDSNGDVLGFSMMAAGDNEAVVLYVDSDIDTEYVDLFSERMDRVNEIIPEYADRPIYGAIAYLKKKNSEGIAMAQRKGFFVIRATGSSASIINKEDFKPTPF